MAPVLVGTKGNMGFAQRVHPDPEHPSWVAVRRFLSILPDIELWQFHVSPAESSREAPITTGEEQC